MSHKAASPRPLLGIISDEAGPRLDDCLAVCTEQGFDQVEVRMIDGIPPLSLTDAQAKEAKQRITASGLSVAGIATPLLKWEAPGRKAADQGDQFGFSRDGRSDDDLTSEAIRIADIFETRNLRIFSYLTHEGFVLDDLAPALDGLLEHAERHDKVLLMENEPVCNIARFDQLAELVERYDTPRLKPLPDIGNSAQIREFPTKELVHRVVGRCEHIHFKDYSSKAGKFVTLGTGVVALGDYMAAICESAGARQLSFSLETHTHDDPRGGTEASARKLKQLAEHYFPPNRQ